MKILFITGSFPPMKCGVGDYTALLASELSQQQDIQVAVLTGSAAKKNKDSCIDLIPIIKKWNFLTLHKVVHAIRKWNPDIVHIQYPTAGYGRVLMPNILPLVLRFFNIRVVQTWHEPPILPYLFNALTRDRVIVVDPDIKSDVNFFYKLFFLKKKLHYIPIGSNIPKAILADSERLSIRSRYGRPNDYLIVYFGFISPCKGVDAIFEICDPRTDRIVIIGDLSDSDSYHKKIIRLTKSMEWSGKSFTTGFLAVEQAAQLLAVADAAIFPFLEGTSKRKGSLLAAKIQGTFILTTHRHLKGYDAAENIYYAKPGDHADMRQALRKYIGSRIGSLGASINGNWYTIARTHVNLYKETQP